MLEMAYEMLDNAENFDTVNDKVDRERDVSADGDSDFRDVNVEVVEEWTKEATSFERLYAVVRRTYEPQSASEIANRARVSLPTAQQHLQMLVKMQQVTTSQDDQTTIYRRADTAIVTEHAHRLLESHTTEELIEGIAEMKASIRALRDQYGVETPEELAHERNIIQRPGFCSGSDRTCTAWLTTRRNLALARAALAIAEAEGAGHLSGSNGDLGRKGPDASVLYTSTDGRADVDDVSSKADEDFGPIDAGALHEIRNVFTETEPLVVSAGMDDSMNPQTLHVELSDGIGDATSARFDVRVNLAGDYAFYYMDDEGKEFRYDSHPRSDDIGAEHVHLPAHEPSEPVASCIGVTELVLVTRSVLKLWRGAYERASLNGINGAQTQQ